MKLIDEKKFLEDVNDFIHYEHIYGNISFDDNFGKKLKKVLSKYLKDLPKKRDKFKTQYVVMPQKDLRVMDSYVHGYNQCLEDCEKK